MANTSFAARGLALSIYEPLWRGGAFYGDYGQQATAYAHTIANVGGFFDASLTLSESVARLENWLDNGLGRRVVVSADADSVVWEGFVNQIEINVAGVRKTIGPYLDIANKIKLIYSSFDTSTGVVLSGLRLSTDYVTNAASIAKYGTLTKILSTSGVSDDMITYLLNLTLDKLSRPTRSEDLTVPAQNSAFELRLDCVGYQALLGRFPYNNTATALVNVSDKLKAILQAEPNSTISTDLTGITANTLQVSSYEQDDNMASDIIKGIVNLGDISGNRYTFGLYENRRAVYQPISQSIKYLRPLREGASIILDNIGGVVAPWRIRPGAWIWVADLLPAKAQEADLDNDARAIFAETVSFRAPDTLTINGAHTFKIEQKLNQLGIGGFS